MKAIRIREPGGPEVLQLVDAEMPSPRAGEVRIRVVATAVNRADLLQRLGAYPAPKDAPQDIPGLEVSGVVDALGEGVASPAVGTRVYAIVGGGGYAEYVTVHARALAPIPEGLGDVEAAAVPEAFVTAYDAMVLQAGLAPGENVLIHAVGSGVGTAATQIAVAIGARPLGTARTDDKLERAKALGLVHGIHVQNARFSDAVHAATAGQGADVILDLVGGSYGPENLRAAAPRGRIVVVGLVAGRSMELDLGLLLQKRLLLKGTVLRARPLEERIAAHQVLARNLGPLFAAKQLRPVVDRVLPLAQAADAHRAMAESESFGKLVLTTG